MRRQVVILPAAEDDLDAGQQFYEEQSPGLGEYFLDSLASDIESLLIHGGVHRVVHGFHRCFSKRFPYAIFYLVQANVLSVYAVLDCRQDPDELSKQLDNR